VIHSFEDHSPRLGSNVFVAPGAQIIGDVVAGDDSSFWYNVVVRGDVCPIRIGQRVNIQDLTMIHVTSGEFPCTVEDDVTVGHKAILHGCTVRKGSLIGMGAILLDGAEVGEECLIGAGALIPPGKVIPPRSLVIGEPGKVRRSLTEEEVANLYKSARHYVETARRHRASLGEGTC